MPTVLDEIIDGVREDLAGRRAATPLRELEARAVDAMPPIDPLPIFRAAPGVAVIAEVKRRSPAAGAIRGDADAAEVASRYASSGAACISILTDATHFGGSLDDLRSVRAAASVPLLRKDFILDRYQVLEARLAGADAVLLIAECLDDANLTTLLRDIHDFGMDALAECYEEENVKRLVDAGAKLLGINNRDLRTFAVNLDHTLNLARHVPAACTVVSESGIRSQSDVERLAEVGIAAPKNWIPRTGTDVLAAASVDVSSSSDCRSWTDLMSNSPDEADEFARDGRLP